MTAESVVKNDRPGLNYKVAGQIFAHQKLESCGNPPVSAQLTRLVSERSLDLVNAWNLYGFNKFMYLKQLGKESI